MNITIKAIVFLSFFLTGCITNNTYKKDMKNNQSPIDIQTDTLNNSKESFIKIYPHNFSYIDLKKLKKDSSLKDFYLSKNLNQKIFINYQNEYPILHIQNLPKDQECTNIGEIVQFHIQNGKNLESFSHKCTKETVLKLNNENSFLFKERLEKSEPIFTIHLHNMVEFIPNDNTEIYANLDEHIYKLHNIHFHTISEHTINKKHHPLELHAVFKNKENEIAVLSILYKENNNNSYFNEVLGDILNSKDKNHAIYVDKLIPKENYAYNYVGSLTTKPYTGDVKWFIFEQIQDVSSDNLKKIQNIIKSNNRKIQPKNDRQLYKLIMRN